jgi:hypothetical protein
LRPSRRFAKLAKTRPYSDLALNMHPSIFLALK